MGGAYELSRSINYVAFRDVVKKGDRSNNFAIRSWSGSQLVFRKPPAFLHSYGYCCFFPELEALSDNADTQEGF